MSVRRKKRESCCEPSCDKLLIADSSISCDDCKNKYHLQCTDLSKEIRDVLVAQKIPEGLFFRCIECRTKPILVVRNEFDIKMNEISEQLKCLNAEFSKRLDFIENQNLAFPKEVKDSITSYAKVVSNNIKENNETKKVVSSMHESISNLESNFNSKMEVEQTSLTAINQDLKAVKSNTEKNDEKEVEARAKALKEKNLCIFNVPELKSNDRDASYRHDIEAVKSIFDGKVNLQKEDVKAMFRIGMNKDQTTSRPIILKFSSIDKKK